MTGRAMTRSLRTKPESTEARILDAAQDLFLDHNYADVTTDMITRAAGVTKGGLYHHFSSKSELYVVMMIRDLESKQQLFEQAVRTVGTCRDRLSRLTRDYLELPDAQQRITRLVRRDINSFGDEERDRLVRAYQRALPEQIEAIIRDGIRDGELSPADTRLLSWSFVALFEVVIGDYADRLFDSTEARLEQVLTLFFEGAAAKPVEVTT